MISKFKIEYCKKLYSWFKDLKESLSVNFVDSNRSQTLKFKNKTKTKQKGTT